MLKIPLGACCSSIFFFSARVVLLFGRIPAHALPQNQSLDGGIATPLKNKFVRQLG